MLPVIGIAFCVWIICLVLVWKRRKSRKMKTTIPGPYSSYWVVLKTFGPDVSEFGNQSAYLSALHQKYGPIVAFWEANKMAVSIASPELMQEVRHLNNLTLDINEPFREITGDNSLFFQNGEEANKRRRIYDHCFGVTCNDTQFEIVKEIAEDYLEKWKGYKEILTPLTATICDVTYKAMLRTIFGDYFNDEERLYKFIQEFKWLSMNSEKAKFGDAEEKAKLQASLKYIKDTVRLILDARRDEIPDDNFHLFIDSLLEKKIPEAQCISDSITFFIAGVDTTSMFLAWILYQLADKPILQQTVYEELNTFIEEESFEQEKLSQFVYLRQVIDEALRYYLRFHSGRIVEEDMVLGGHFIPKGTNIYLHLGECLHDPTIWDNPEEFDPDRFSPETSKDRHPCAFRPFGLAGYRQCPGSGFAYMMITTFLSMWLQKYQFDLAPGQNITEAEAECTAPDDDEVWLTITPREKN